MTANVATFRLLALCARAASHPAFLSQLSQLVADYSDWAALPKAAEAHGLAPLILKHLNAVQAPLPSDIKLVLGGLAMRHRHANAVRAAALADILRAYAEAGIDVLVLKGMALAHAAYPDPALRPMSDLDLLVPPPDLLRASDLLPDLGYSVAATAPESDDLPARHLRPATQMRDGVSLSVELHHSLFDSDQMWEQRVAVGAEVRHSIARGLWYPPLDTHADLTGPPYPFAVAGQAAHTLDHADNLRHVWEHMAAEPLRLGRVADMVVLAERFVHDIDWARLATQAPALLRTLSLYHGMTPLSDDLLAASLIEAGHEPQGVGLDYQGWPNVSFGTWRQSGLGHLIAQTLTPSEWWLRLYYGLGSQRPLAWTRWARHPLQVVRWAVGRLRGMLFAT